MALNKSSRFLLLSLLSRLLEVEENDEEGEEEEDDCGCGNPANAPGIEVNKVV